VAQLRGRGRPSFSVGPVQRAIGYLVSSLLLSVGPLTQAAGALPPPPLPVLSAPPPVASAIDISTLVEAPEAAGPSLATNAVITTTGAQETGLTVTVVRGDSPWSLAETHLGDGLRWRELWEANSTRVQPDGTTWASADAPIRPGWELAVPGIAGPSEVPGAVAGEVTVATGDNFWDLAEGELSHAWGRAPTDAEVVPHWQSLIEANRDRLAPPGDPDLIYPGQLFVVPEVPADPTAPPVAAT
jgi:nucleoid-associated protein YgaU